MQNLIIIKNNIYLIVEENISYYIYYKYNFIIYTTFLRMLILFVKSS